MQSAGTYYVLDDHGVEIDLHGTLAAAVSKATFQSSTGTWRACPSASSVLAYSTGTAESLSYSSSTTSPPP